MKRLAVVGAVGVTLAGLAAGCGSHHTALKPPARASTKRSPTAARTSTSITPEERRLSKGGLFTNTCPKSIAAHCVPGLKMGAIVCVGRQGRVARTPTLGDFKRMNEEAAKAQQERREGKKPKQRKHQRQPTTLSLHVLPNGRSVGTCNYGGGPPPVPAPPPASIAANE